MTHTPTTRCRTLPTRLFFVLVVACVCVQLFAVEYHFNRCVSPNWLRNLSSSTFFSLTANNIGDALIVLLPFLALPPRWRRFGWIGIWLVTFWCTAQLLYLPTYRDLMPFGSFLLVENIGPTLLASTLGAFSLGTLETIVPPVALYIAYRLWFRDALGSTHASATRRIAASALAIAAFCLIRLGATAVHQADDRTPAFARQFSEDYAVMRTRQGDYLNLNGAVAYALYSFHHTLFSTASLSDAQRRQVERFLDGLPRYTDNRFAVADSTDAVLLIVESLNAWVIDLKINGREITPTLNALCRDTSVIVGTQMKTQVRNGRSSDGLFMYNTGLLPLPVAAVANTYPDACYPTLLGALPQYNTFYACCDEPSLWNVENMAANYGYDHFYGRADINATIKSNGFRVDKALLEHALRWFARLRPPRLALIHTAGMHSPYTNAIDKDSWIQQSGAYTHAVRCYLERCEAFDSALAEFLGKLPAGTLLVLASDHTEYIDDDPDGRPAIDTAGDNGVLIVRGARQSLALDRPFGQIDLYPTLLDLLGANHYRWKGLGHSLLRFTPTGVTPARNDSSELINQWIITSRYFDTQ